MVEGENTTVFHLAVRLKTRRTANRLPRRRRRAPDGAFRHRRPEFPLGNQTRQRPDYHFSTNTAQTPDPKSPNPRLKWLRLHPRARSSVARVANTGEYHPQPEWCEHPAPVQQSRARLPAAMAHSPGWFELPLPKGASVTLVATAEAASFEVRRRFKTEIIQLKSQNSKLHSKSNFYAPRSNLSSAAAKA